MKLNTSQEGPLGQIKVEALQTNIFKKTFSGDLTLGGKNCIISLEFRKYLEIEVVDN